MVSMSKEGEEFPQVVYEMTGTIQFQSCGNTFKHKKHNDNSQCVSPSARHTKTGFVMMRMSVPLWTCPAQPPPAVSQGTLAVLSKVGHSFLALLPWETTGVQGCWQCPAGAFWVSLAPLVWRRKGVFICFHLCFHPDFIRLSDFNTFTI